MSYDSVSTKAAKIRLAIRYADNSRRALPKLMMERGDFAGIDANYDAIEAKLRAELAALDALLDEMEEV